MWFRRRSPADPLPTRPDPRLTRSVVPFTAVGDRVVTLRQGGYAALVETNGLAFDLLPEAAQDAVIQRFLDQVLHGLDHPLQITAITEPADLAAALAWWQAAVQRTPPGSFPHQVAAGFRSIWEQHAVGGGGVPRMERTVYVFTVPGNTPAEADRRADTLALRLERVHEDLEPRRCDTDRVLALLAQGFGVPLPGPAHRYLQADPIRLALDGTGSPDPDHPLALTAGSETVPPPLRAPDLVAPAGWRVLPGALQIGPDLWAQTLTAAGWPGEAFNGFLHPVYRAHVPLRFAWHIRPLNPAAMVQQLQREMEQHIASRNIALKQGKIPDADLDQKLAYADELRRALQANTLRLFELVFLTTIFGTSPEELRAHVQTFLEAAAPTLWIFRPTFLEQAAGFLSTLPTGRPTVGARKQIDSVSLALMFPMTHREILDPSGLYLGLNLTTSGAVSLALTDRKRFPVAHLIAVGQTRSGKSYTAKTLLAQILADPTWEACVIDPSPPIDYQAFATRYGRFLRFRPGSPDRWNVCAIEYPADAATLAPDERRLVSEKVEWLITLLSLLAPDHVTPTTRALAERVIRQAYTDRQIVDGDLASLIEPGTLAVDQPVMKAMPTLSELADRFAHAPEPALHELALILQPYCTGGALDLFDAPVNPPLDDARLLVFNVEGITRTAPELAPLVYFLVAEIIAQRLRSRRTAAGQPLRTVVAIDEAHYLFQRADVATWVNKLYRTAGKLGGAVWLLTQSITDLIGDPDSGITVAGAEQAKTCFTNSTVAWIGKQTKEADLKLIARQWSLAPHEVDLIRRAELGQGLWVAEPASGRRIHVFTQTIAPPPLDAILRTQPEERPIEAVYPDPLDGRRPVPPAPAPPDVPAAR